MKTRPGSEATGRMEGSGSRLRFAGIAPAAPSRGCTALAENGTVSPLATQNNGGFNWGSRWSIQGATSSDQWLDRARRGRTTERGGVASSSFAWHHASDRAGPSAVGWSSVRRGTRSGRRGRFERGRRSSVALLRRTRRIPYGQPPVGAEHEGHEPRSSDAPDLDPNLTSPAALTVRNAAPAWRCCRVTNTSPNLSGGTGALAHNSTATWGWCQRHGSVTAATTV